MHSGSTATMRAWPVNQSPTRPPAPAATSTVSTADIFGLGRPDLTGSEGVGVVVVGQDLVERAPRPERAGVLQQLQLEDEREINAHGARLTVHYWRRRHPATDPRRSSRHVISDHPCYVCGHSSSVAEILLREPSGAVARRCSTSRARQELSQLP